MSRVFGECMVPMYVAYIIVTMRNGMTKRKTYLTIFIFRSASDVPASGEPGSRPLASRTGVGVSMMCS
jgi:hypothetical protein